MHPHDHHHDHEHDHEHDPERDGAEELDQPLDRANQSLSDALLASFRVLKGIMLVLVVLYAFSNVRSIGGHEQALIVRTGRLQHGVREAGLVWAFPYPIDEVVRLPTRKSNDLMIDSHTFHREKDEVGKPLSFISRTHGGLRPSLDGALITADAGLVHCRWKVTYKIDDVNRYVTEFVGDQVGAAEQLIRTCVETVGIQVATEMTAEEMIRTRVDHVQSEMLRRVNRRLLDLRTGVLVTLIEMQEPTPPLQVRDSFDNTQRAENAKQQRIREAELERTKILNGVAGAAYLNVVEMLDKIDASPNAEETVRIETNLDRLLDEKVEGKAGRMIKDAGAYHSVAVSRIQSDVELYRTLLPEYERNPSLLIGRLWEQTLQDILESSGVIKFYRPPGLRELRIKIPLDPEQTEIDEKLKLQKKEFDPNKLKTIHYEPVGPEHD